MTISNFWWGGEETIDSVIGNSLRFRGGQALTRTFAGTPTTWTFSFWIKRAILGTNQRIVGVRTAGTISNDISFDTDDSLYLNSIPSAILDTTSLYRDPSAWMHVVVNSTPTNAEIHVNGIEVASAAAGYELFDSAANGNKIGGEGDVAGGELNAYLAEVHHIDGQALDPTDFGEYDANGVWVPIEPTGLTYGTNGFHLDFSDPADIGADRSGNGNDFTATGFELVTTTSTNYALMEDSPTQNYATFSPLTPLSTNNAFADANLKYIQTASVSGSPYTTDSTQQLSGKIYLETSLDIVSTSGTYAVASSLVNETTGGLVRLVHVYTLSGTTSGVNSISTSGAAQTLHLAYVSGVYGFAVDASTGEVWVHGPSGWIDNKDPTGVALATIDMSSGVLVHQAWGRGNSNSALVNYGQQPFIHTLPDGFKALQTANLPAAPIRNGRDHFRALAVDALTGALGAGQAVFPNGLWWIKSRVNPDATYNAHQLVDSVRGGNLAVACPDNRAESAYIAPTNDCVTWCWSAPEVFDPMPTSSGMTAATGQRNVDAGFSIVAYTPGPYSTGNMRVGTGFQVPAEFCLIQNRALPSSGANQNWIVWHKSSVQVNPFNVGSIGWFDLTPGTLNLSLDNAAVDYGADSQTIGNGENYIMYCWHSVPGYSAFGSYEGNGSTDGPFVYTGFRPAWIMMKRTDGGGGNWVIQDTTRSITNVVDNALSPDLTSGDSIGNGHNTDFLSNGFKLRSAGTGVNQGNIIYAAFAENPFGGSNVSPANAR